MKGGTKLIVASNSVASMGWGICWTYLNLRLRDIGANYLQLCLMDSLAAIAYLLSRFWGALSDYYGVRKNFMLVGFLASATPLLVMAIFNYLIWALILAYFACCFFWAMAYPSFLAALTSDPEREKATTAFALAGTTGWALGAFSMGFLELMLGPARLFVFCYLVFVVFTSMLAFYEEERLPRKPGTAWSYVKGTFTLRFRARKGFGLLLVGVFLGWLGLQWSSPLARIRMYDLLGHSKTVVGVVWGLSSISSAIALLLAERAVEKLGGLKTYAIATACYSILMPSFALILDPVLYAVLWTVPVWPFFNLGYTLSPAEFSSEDVRGEAVGACEVAKNLGVLSGMLGGLVADMVGRETSMLLSAFPLGLGTIPLLFCMRVSNSEEAIPEEVRST